MNAGVTQRLPFVLLCVVVFRFISASMTYSAVLNFLLPETWMRPSRARVTEKYRKLNKLPLEGVGYIHDGDHPFNQSKGQT